MADGSDNFGKRKAALMYGALLMADAAERARVSSAPVEETAAAPLARIRFLAASTGAFASARTQYSQDDRALQIRMQDEDGVITIALQAIGFVNINRYRERVCLLVSDDGNLRHVVKFDGRARARVELSASEALRQALRSELRLEPLPAHIRPG